MPHDYRLIYRTGVQILQKVGWNCDPNAMFRAPSLAKGTLALLECEQLAARLHLPLPMVQGDLITAARIHHFVTICGNEAGTYFLIGQCPIEPKKIALLSRRMPPFIRAKMKSLLAGSVNVVSNPDHAFDTDGWPELKRRLPKFRATMEHYAAGCTGVVHAPLSDAETDGLAAKLRSIEHHCDLIEEKLGSTVVEGDGRAECPSPKSTAARSSVDWSKAYQRVSIVLGVLEKTNRDLRSEHWKPAWMPTNTDINATTVEVETIRQAAAKMLAWLRR